MIKSAQLFAPMTLVAATLLLATPSQAQQARPGEQLGMRYLSWAGKPAGMTTDGLRRPADRAPQVQTAGLTEVMPPAPSARPNRYGAVSRVNGPTAASAWIAPRTAQVQTETQPRTQAAPASHSDPAPAPAPMPAAPEVRAVADAPPYDPSRAIRRQDPYYGAPPEVQAAMQPTPQPVPLPPPPPIPAATEAPADQAAADPMAPRRDAMIFRMGVQAPAAQDPRETTPPMSEAPRQLAQAMPARSDAPARQGARYYSVHREAGHQPDPMTLPESVFIGGSADLAEPPPAPVLPRTINGRAQAVVPNQDPALP